MRQACTGADVGDTEVVNEAMVGAVPVVALATQGASAGLFGQGSTAAPVATIGGLAIVETSERTRDFNANVGFTRHTVLRFQVLHQGRFVKLPDEAGQSAEQDFWDAWVLPAAPRPAVLAGKEALYLFTEDSGQVRAQMVAPADEHRHASVQWLDAENGQPGPEHIVDIRDSAEDARQLHGGRRLLLNHRVVLDVTSLRSQAIELMKAPGFGAPGEAVLALSPKGSRLASKLQSEAGSAHDGALLLIKLVDGQRDLLHFDAKRLGASTPEAMTRAGLAEHFEWVHGPGGDERLQRRAPPAGPKPRWQSRYEIGSQAPMGRAVRAPRYLLWPVAPAMWSALLSYAEDELQGRRVAAEAGDPPSASFARLMMAHVPVTISYEASKRQLVVLSEFPGGELWSKQVVEILGEWLDAELATGRLQQNLMAPPAAR